MEKKEPQDTSQGARKSRFLPLRESVLGSAWFLPTALLIIAVDLWTKAWAWGFVPAHGAWLRVLPDERPRQIYAVVDGFFYIAREENPGTVWGLFQGFTGGLTILRIGMVIFLLVFAAMLARNLKLARWGLACVLGGAVGNLYDNLITSEGVQIKGAVRDFLDFYLPLPWMDQAYHYPTFNVADASILIGAVLLFLGLGKEQQCENKAEAGEAAVADVEEQDG